MRRSNKLLALTAGIAAASLLAAVLNVPTVIMAPLAFLLLASVGYLWIEVILQDRAPTVERVTAAVGLVLAVPVLGGVVLDEANVPLHRVAWSCLFVALTLIGDLVLALRYRKLRGQADEQQQDSARRLLDQRALTRPDLLAVGEPLPGRPARAAQRRRVSPWQAIACGLAVVIAGSALWIARAGATSQAYPGFTELGLSSKDHSTYVDNLEVTNHEGKTEKYRLVLLRKGHVSATWELTLASGQSWQKIVQIKGPTTANLYLLPDLSRPYRYVDTEP
jgi:hypothetical protein